MSIYGDPLLCFTEQMRDIQYFTQIARVGAGYDKVGDVVTIRGIWQAGKGKEVFGATGRLSQHSGWKTLGTVDKPELWTSRELQIGQYVKSPVSERVFILERELDWSFEAGFHAYSLDKVIGDDGVKDESLTIIEGTY